MKRVLDTTPLRYHPLTRSKNRNDQPLWAQSQAEKAQSSRPVSTNVGTNFLDSSSDHLLRGYWWWFEGLQAATGAVRVRSWGAADQPVSRSHKKRGPYLFLSARVIPSQ